MTKKQLMEKYGDDDLVEDIIKQKRAMGKAGVKPHPEVSRVELFFCWDSQKVDSDSENEQETGLRATGDIAHDQACQMAQAMLAPLSEKKEDEKKDDGKDSKKQKRPKKGKNIDEQAQGQPQESQAASKPVDHLKARGPTNQATNQPSSQPTYQPTNQPASKPTNQPTNSPIHQKTEPIHAVY
jgi:hypothetical protein